MFMIKQKEEDEDDEDDEMYKQIHKPVKKCFRLYELSSMPDCSHEK